MGTNGVTAPTSSTEIGGINNSGNLQPLQTDSSGNLKVTIAGSTTTEAVNLTQVGGAAISLGQQLAASSLPVVLTAAQLTTLTPPTTVTVIQPTAANLNATVTGTVAVSNFPATQPISGTVTANQGTANGTPWNSNTAQINGVAPLMGNGVTGTGSQRVTIASDNTAFNIKVSDGTNTAAVKAASTAAVATDPSLVVQLSPNGNAPIAKGRASANAPAINQYGSTNVTTAAYVQLVASTTSATNLIEIFDSSGQTMILGVGAAASEVVQLYIIPGGNGQVPLSIPAGSRVAIKAQTATASSGYIVINFYT